MIFKRKRGNDLDAVDFYYANDPGYLKRRPDVMKALIEHAEQHMPRECLECFFFGWLWKEGKQFAGCSICDNIAFVYGQRAPECPLDPPDYRGKP